MITPPQRVSDIIGAIYDCVIEPDRWTQALADLCALTHFVGGVIAVNRLPSGEGLVSAAAGFAPQWLARVNDYPDDVIPLWGGAERVARFPLDEPIVCTRATPPANWQQNRFYLEWARPQGLIDSVSIVLARDPGAVGNVTFGRHHSAGEVSEPDLELLRIVAPHMRRAVTIARLLEHEAFAADTLAATLEALAVPVFVVDDDLAILFANQRARDFLADGTLMRSYSDRLSLTSSAASEALRTAVSRAIRDEAQLGTTGLAIPLGDASCASVAHVLPLPRRALRRGRIPAATAAVFVARAAVSPRLPADAIALLYEFTPAESRIFEMVVDGMTQPDIADALGIAPSTVKTHLLRVFDKTGVHRQADLVKLAASLSLPA